MKNYLFTSLLLTTLLFSCGGRERIRLSESDITKKMLCNTIVRATGVANITLTGDNPDSILLGSTIHLNGKDSWLIMPNISRSEWIESDLCAKIKVNGKRAILDVNAQLTNYYNGVYLKPQKSEDNIAATVFSAEDKIGCGIELSQIYIDDEIPVGNDKISRITLTRGNMVVLAENSDGTGASEVYIATNKCLDINLPEELSGRVSFVRVQPWNYVTKRGIGGNFPRRKELGINWYYNWSTKMKTTHEVDYAPMFWGNSSSDGVDSVIAKSMTNNILSFNEPDGKDQANLSPEEALERYPSLLRTGVRIGSPACREGQWNTWLSDFMEGCEERGYRVDFIATHWYDWGNWSKTKDATPEDIDAIVDRFKIDIDKCYEKYGLPIWITEFNANKNRLPEIQIEFLKRAIPMLESHPHVERYAYFQPFGGNGKFLVNDELSETAKAYAYMESTPSTR